MFPCRFALDIIIIYILLELQCNKRRPQPLLQGVFTLVISPHYDVLFLSASGNSIPCFLSSVFGPERTDFFKNAFMIFCMLQR